MIRKQIVCFWVVILSGTVLYGKGEVNNPAFRAVLLQAEISSDLYQPDDTMYVTCWFQNTGTSTSPNPLKGFAELSFGHQRILENTPKYFRYYWDPYPSTDQWKPGDIWKTTFKCKMNLGWGGAYTVKIGLCDENHLPVKITGTNGKLMEQVEVSRIDLGWGWGTPTMNQVRKPLTKEFNQSVPPIAKKNLYNSPDLTIGTNPKVYLNNLVPEITAIAGIAMNESARGMLPSVTVREYAKDSLIYSGSSDVKVVYTPLQEKNNQVNYTGKVSFRKKEIAEYTLRFEMFGDELHLSLIDVKEKDGYELLEINMPSLLSLDGETDMVSFTAGGRILSLDRAIPEGYSFKYDTRNAAALLKSNDKLVLESTCIDDRLNIAVFDNGKDKTANLGMVFVNRVRGKGRIASIPVEHDHTVKINLLNSDWGNDGWQSVAKFWRKDLKSINKDLYRRALVHKQLATVGPEPPVGYVTEQSPYSVKRLTSVITFKEIFEIVKKYCNILDGMPQVLYIGGFQEGGFDNSYPYVLNTDRRLGTVEELKYYIQEARKYNTVLSLHDNYDSDVLNSPHYDPRIVCLDEEGKPWMGWFWAGGADHIVAPYKYGALGLMQKRVKETIETYGIKGSYHLDVLTSELLRYDFDPEYPASAEKSLKGKLDIIDEFNKYGIDITSETLLHPFVGRIGFGLHARTDMNAVFFSGEKFIPLVDMVYHGILAYEGGGRSEQAMLMGLMKGSSIFVSEEGIKEEDIQWIYLHQMPVGLLYDKQMDQITEKDGITTVSYDAGTYVKVDFDKKNYEIQVDGRLIAKDRTTFIPSFKPDTYLAFSKEGGAFSYPAPEGWNEKTKIKAVTLTFEGEGIEAPCAIKNGIFSMDIPAATPVRVFLNQSEVKVENDIRYGEAVNDRNINQALLMDRYYLEENNSKEKKPAVILVHGGGFNLGDKKQELYVKMAEAFVSAGYVSFSVNYRLNSTGKINVNDLDNAVSDLLSAVYWIQTHSDEYGINPDKIIIAGDSAGGGIVINTAYSDSGKTRISGCIDLWGGLCFNRLNKDANQWGEPVNYYPIKKDVPPTCIIHGDKDEVVPFRTSEDLADELARSGVYHELHILKGALHYPEAMADEFIPIMINFADKIK
ncbi:MAG: alpha/beta hydrolase fold domain-containing protein [Candidatus Azobacteroides sp.]|nr:alpha/beta hydrolase fold domain-containing protein [Candidatus Azobacteroides sp.]